MPVPRRRDRHLGQRVTREHSAGSCAENRTVCDASAIGEGGDRKFADFVVEENPKVDHFIDLIGIESPGLTSAPAIADMVVDIIGNREALVEGFSLVKRRLERVLQDEGAERIDCVGKTFDPSLHRAVGVEESEDHPADTVLREDRPGFVEMDLVAHCGETTAGVYLNTLCVVDIATGWTEPVAVANKGQKATFEGIQTMRRRLPFPLLGIDSDNGSEFINDHLRRYCLKEQITFTRSRPYKKNDQAHVEQKNWTAVRRWVGYDRYESPEALALLEAIYADLRLFINVFQPVMKLVEKKRVGSQVHKKYDTAQTPYQRMLASPNIDDSVKDQLRELYPTLNPLALQRRIEANLKKLWALDR